MLACLLRDSGVDSADALQLQAVDQAGALQWQLGRCVAAMGRRSAVAASCMPDGPSKGGNALLCTAYLIAHGRARFLSDGGGDLSHYPNRPSRFQCIIQVVADALLYTSPMASCGVASGSECPPPLWAANECILLLHLAPRQ